MIQNKAIVIINGSGGCGKDTFVKFCKKITTDGDIVNDSPIFISKLALSTLLGIDMYELDNSKSEDIRAMLVELNHFAIEHGDHPAKYIEENIYGFLARNAKVMFLHIREPGHIDFYINMINDILSKPLKWFANNNKPIACPLENIKVKTLLIKRPDVAQITSNVADASVLNYDYDDIIINDDFNQLKYKAEKWLKKLEVIE